MQGRRTLIKAAITDPKVAIRGVGYRAFLDPITMRLFDPQDVPDLKTAYEKKKPQYGTPSLAKYISAPLRHEDMKQPETPAPLQVSTKDVSLSKRQDTIFLFNLPYETTPSDIDRLMSRFGVVKSIKLVYSPFTYMPRGYGFVTFGGPNAAAAVSNACKCTLDIRGRRVKTDIVRNGIEGFTCRRLGGGMGGQQVVPRGTNARRRRPPRHRRGGKKSRRGLSGRRVFKNKKVRTRRR